MYLACQCGNEVSSALFGKQQNFLARFVIKHLTENNDFLAGS